jgi:RimJ/RimL family protein N-acetyltransferase
VTGIAKAPALQTSELRLIPYAAEHDTQTIAWLNNPELQGTFGLSRRITRKSHRAWLAANPDILIWAITGKPGGHFGNVLLQTTPTRGSGYLQIYLGEPAARGRGIGWQALARILDFGFNEYGLHRIWLHTLPDNQTAAALYAKAGFVREGVEREALPRDGGFTDQYRWSLLAQEWNSRAKAATS